MVNPNPYISSLSRFCRGRDFVLKVCSIGKWCKKVSDVSNRPCTCFVKKSSPIAGQSILLVRNGVLSGIVCRVFHKVKDRVRWSIGRNPRIHAIWTPQCGWEKGKMCFIKRKDKTFVSNNRDLQKKIVVIFREDRSKNKNKWTFSRMSSTFICKFSLF